MRVAITKRSRIWGHIEEIVCLSGRHGEVLVVKETATGGFEVTMRKPEEKEGGS